MCIRDRYIYGVYFVPKHQAHKVHAVYSSMHFEQIFVPDCYTGTAREAFSKLEQRHKEIHAGLDANQTAADSFLKDNCQDIVSAKAALDACSSSFDIRKLAACTRTRDEVNPFYILCGWMTEKDALAFQEDIRDDDKIFCLMEDEESPAKKTPPTKLHNPKLFRPFEMYEMGIRDRCRMLWKNIQFCCKKFAGRHKCNAYCIKQWKQHNKSKQNIRCQPKGCLLYTSTTIRPNRHSIMTFVILSTPF